MNLKKTAMKELIFALDFQLQEGTTDIYFKSYLLHDGYIIRIDLNTEAIEYGTKIALYDMAVTQLGNNENFVILECLDRLLKKNYPPEKISLGHKLSLAKKEKASIFIYDQHANAYLVLECKTWGDEYEKEKKKMQRDGGVLFSYFQHDKSIQYLCLYTSRVHKEHVEFINEIVPVDRQWHEFYNQKEIFTHWNKNFKDNGIFDSWAGAYNIEIKALTRNRLKELTEEDSGRIFNQFAEILRHNVISDKANAFNKILNLFICKISDEDRGRDDELYFQWLETDDHKKLQTRLNDLYKDGMKCFLDIEVTDYTDKQIEKKLCNVNELEVKKQIQEMFQHLRLQKNPEFAFKEVYNDKSFYDNAQVVKEVVELLQPYQFIYGHKQQFLGNFFELLLNTSIKQESGQFFTPVPITRFIISCLPIKEFIEQRIANNAADILPCAIDYATGSGHFLTEWMDELQSVINNLASQKMPPTAAKKIQNWQLNELKWSSDYVYGIEADYRLVKTAKVSTFLNGDGGAVIIRANGLDNFQQSSDFKGRLKKVQADDTKDNGQFDVLIANPPYSVSAFKNTLKFGKESFELFDRLSEQSSEIECLFIERTKQLLRPGGWAGVILPSSILSNSGIYTNAREIIFKYFNLKAIAEFGSNVFMATATNTVTLFLERKDNSIWKNIKTLVQQFFVQPEDGLVNGIANAFSRYVLKSFDELELADYISLIKQKPNQRILKQEFFSDYKIWFNSLTEIKLLKEKKGFKLKLGWQQQAELDKLFYAKVFACEQEKMLYFFLVYPQQTVVVKVGEKQVEKDFIGYEFSMRRGHEGIKMYRDENGQLTTKLYDDKNHLNPEKASSYIYRSFLNEKFNIDESLVNNISVFDTFDLIDFNKVIFEKSISLASKKKAQIPSRYNLMRVRQICELGRGRIINKDYIKNNGGEYPVYSSQTVEDGVFGYINSYDFEGEYVTWTTDGANAGTVSYRNGQFNCTNVCGTLKGKDTKLNLKYLALVLNRVARNHVNYVGNPKLMNEDMAEIQIPVPPQEVQEQIIAAMDLMDQKKKSRITEIEALQLKKNYRINELAHANESIAIASIASVKGGKRVPKGYKLLSVKTKFPYIRVSDFADGSISTTNLRYLDENTFNKISAYVINSDEVYISIAGTIGLVGIVPDELDGKSLTENAAKITIIDKTQYDFHFLYYVLTSDFVQQQLKQEIKSVGVPKLALKRIETILIPKVELTEQVRAVTEFKKLEKQVQAIKDDLANIAEEKNKRLNEYLY